MSYLVLARKWRPAQLSEMVGQGHVTKTLANAIEMDRVAHAFVFSGVRGVGKTSLARILAKSLNCVQGATVEPCGECESCRSIAAGTAVDVIEVDGASNNSVDDVRELRETVAYRPQLGRYKIYVIDEVHMLSTSAFNALLKTLEEPPPHVKFIFATTEPHKIPVTVLSRCQRYDFRRIPTAAIVDRIAHILNSEGIEADATALSLIGREADGSMRDALSLLDQVLAASTGTVTGELVSDLLGVAGRSVYHGISGALVDGDPKRCLELVREVDNQGFDMTVFARGLLEHLRNLLVLGVCQGDTSLVQLADEEANELAAQAQRVSADTLHRIFKHFSECYETVARSPHPRIILEASLARIASLGELVPAEAVLRKLEALARAGAANNPGRGAPPSKPAGGQRPERGAGPGPFPQTAGAEQRPAPKLVQPGQDDRAPKTQFSGDPRPLPAGAKWDAFVNGLRSKRPQLASMLECGVPHPDEQAGCLELVFSPEATAAADIVRTPERLRELADLLGEQCNRGVQVSVRIGKSEGIPVLTRKRIEDENRQRELAEKVRHHPVVLRAISEFGGQISEVRLTDGRNEKKR